MVSGVPPEADQDSGVSVQVSGKRNIEPETSIVDRLPVNDIYCGIYQ